MNLKPLTGLFSIALILLFSACSNDTKTKITISGTVNDPELGTPVEGVHVVLYSQKMVNGSWSFNYNQEDSLFTDADGSFQFELEFNYNPAFKLEFDRDQYFPFTYEIPPDEMTGGTSFNSQFELHSRSTINIHLKNNFPFDENDLIKFRIIDWNKSCATCCYTDFYEYVGSDVNITESCELIGESTYTIEYIWVKNGNQNVSMKEVFCPAFGSASVDITY